MIPVLTADEMRGIERDAIASGRVASLEMQERAARGAAALIPEGGPVEVLAGPGNNGADAFAVARLLRQRGQDVRVWALGLGAEWRGDAALQARRWREAGGELHATEAPEEVARRWERRWVVDGLYGLGASRPLSGPAEAWMRAVRDLPVLALDQPSFLAPDGRDGAEAWAPVAATACFGCLKLCHVLEPFRTLCGAVTVVDLGLPEPARVLHRVPTRPALPVPAWDAHKRARGHVAIRAGTMGMSGAAVLAALGALRAGAGLVTVLTDPEVRAEIAAQIPEAMVRPWSGALPEGVDVLLAGPGGVSVVPAWEGRLVLDASALGPGAGPAWMARRGTILTPHPGEFARLFGMPKPAGTAERLAQAESVSHGPGVLLLKGPQSLVLWGESPEVWINDTGHWGLATGGTGDFLSGLVAGLWAQGLGAREAAASAAWLHGTCADRLGKGPLLPRDLAAELPRLLRECHA